MGSRTFTYDSATYLLNPGIGWQWQSASSGDPDETVSYRRSTVGEFFWDEINTADGVYDWSRIDNALSTAAAAGKQLHFRVIQERGEDFGGHKVPQWVIDLDPQVVSPPAGGGLVRYSRRTYQVEWAKFVEAMRVRYDGDPRIAAMDISGFGNFGEYTYLDNHTVDDTPSNPDNLDSYCRRMLMHLYCGGAAADHSDSGGTRSYNYPGWQSTQLIQPDAGIRHHTAMVLEEYPHVGVRTDVLGRTTGDLWDDRELFGEFPSGLTQQGQVESRYLTAPVVYEMAGGASANNTPSNTELKATHGSLVHENGDNGSASAIRSMMLRVGYRFTPVAVTWDDTVAAGAALEFTSNWRNHGYSRNYPLMGQDFEVRVGLRNAGGTVVQEWTLPADTTTWLPAANVDNTPPSSAADDSLTVPGGLAGGSYTLTIGVWDTRLEEFINLAHTASGDVDADGRTDVGQLTVTAAGGGGTLAGELPALTGALAGHNDFTPPVQVAGAAGNDLLIGDANPTAIPVPTVQAGDVLLVLVQQNVDGNASLLTLDGQLTVLADVDATGGRVPHVIGWMRCGSTPPATLNVGWDGAVDGMWSLVALRATNDAADPFTLSPVAASATVASGQAGAAGRLLLSVFMADDGGAASTGYTAPPAGTTVATQSPGDSPDGGFISEVLWASEQLTAGGGTGDRTATASFNGLRAGAAYTVMVDPQATATFGTLAGALPALVGDVAGTVAAENGDGLIHSYALSLVGESPSDDSTLAGTLPTMVGDFAAQVETVTADGDLPAIVGDFTGNVDTAAELAGTLPALTGDLTGISSQPSFGDVAGALPPIRGDLTGLSGAAGPLPDLLGECATRVELQLGDVWENVTPYAYWRDGTVITRGREPSADATDPSQCQFVLLNTDGRFSPRNPASPYYGLLTRNTPVRVAMHALDPALLMAADGRIVTAGSSSALDVTGDIDVRVDVEMPSWRNQRGLCARYTLAGDQRSWAFYVDRDGTLWFLWSPNGTLASRQAVNSGDPVPVTGGRLAVRATLDVNNGSGGHTVRFYTAPTINGPWTFLTGWLRSGGTSVHGGSSEVEVGVVTGLALEADADGRVHAFQLLDGINGTQVANPNLAVQTNDVTSFTDTAGRLWTVDGDAEVTNRRNRFVGEVAAWPQEWEPTEQNVRTAIEAAGITRRLGQGIDPIRSTLRRGIEGTAAALVAYWPFEDGETATQAAPALRHRPMQVVSGALEFGAFDGFAASAALPTMNDADARAKMPQYDTSTGELQVRWLLHVPDGGSSISQTLVQLYTTGSIKTWEVQYGEAAEDLTGDLRLIGRDDDAAEVFNSGWITFQVDGLHLYVQLQLAQVGGSIAWELATLEPNAAQGVFVGGNISGQTLERLWQVAVNPGGGHTDVAFGHLHVQNETTSLFELGDQLAAYDGEHAAARFIRLCEENDIAWTVVGNIDDTALLGPQRPGTLLDLLREAADADGGVLFETRDRLGLTYRTRRSLYNQTPLVQVACGDTALAGPLQPVDDDDGTRNDITVTRTEGSSARAVKETGALSVLPPPAGVGRYTSAYDVNVQSDLHLDGQAGWRLHLGTVDQPRVPELLVSLMNPVVRQFRDLLGRLLGLDVGDRFLVTDPPSWLPPDAVDQLVWGQTESFTDLVDLVYDMTLALGPQRPYEIAAVADEAADGDDVDRWGGAGSTLASAVSSVAGTLSVATAPPPLWTTAAAEFPFTILVGGEEMSLTGVSGGSSPQTFTVGRSVNGVVKSHAAGTAVRLAEPAIRGL